MVPSSGYQDIVDKFPFAADAKCNRCWRFNNRKDWASRPIQRHCQVIPLAAWTPAAGGLNMVNTIDKFPFAADGNATDVGDLTTVAVFRPSGQSSTTGGYTFRWLLAAACHYAFLQLINFLLQLMQMQQDVGRFDTIKVDTWRRPTSLKRY